MQLDNDLLDKWLEFKALTDVGMKKFIEEHQSMRDEIKKLKKDNEKLKDKIFHQHGLVID